MDPELQRLLASARAHNASPEETAAFLKAHGYNPPSEQPPAIGGGAAGGQQLAASLSSGGTVEPDPKPEDRSGLISRIGSSLASIPKDAINSLLTPVQGSTKPSMPGRGGWAGGVRPADAGAVITPENSPGSITPQEQKNAAIHTIGNVASMAVGGPELGEAASGSLTLAKRALQGAKSGGKVGAISGAAQADAPEGSSLAEDVAGRVGGAIKGGAAGAIFGGAAVPAVSSAFNPVINAAGWAGKKLLSATPGLSIAEPTEAELLAQKIFGSAKPGAVKKATKVLFNAQESSGLNPAAEAARLGGGAAAPGAETAAVAGDLGGVPMVRLAGAVARTPGSRAGQEMETAALQRSAGRGARMQKGLENATGEDSALPQLPDQIKADATPAVDEAYDTFRGQNERLPLTPEQQNILARPELKKAFQDANTLAEQHLSAGQREPLEPFLLSDRMNANLPLSDADKQALLQARVKGMVAGQKGAGAGLVAGDIHATTLDRVLSQLDNQIESGKALGKDITGLSAMREKLGTALDQSASNRTARDLAADAAQRSEAAKAGLTAGKMTGFNDKQIQGMLDGTIPLPGEDKATGFPMSAEAAKEFRRGFAGQAGQDLLDRKSNALLNNDKSIVMDRRLRAGLGNEVTDKFMPVAQGETQLSKLEGEVLRGSQTASRAQQDAALNSNPVADAGQAMLGGMGGVSPTARGLKGVLSLARNAVADRANKVSSGVADAATDYLLAGTPGKASLTDAQRYMAIQRLAKANQAWRSSQASRVGGYLVGQQSGTP